MKLRLRYIVLMWLGVSVAITVASPIIFYVLEKAKVEFPAPN